MALREANGQIGKRMKQGIPGTVEDHKWKEI